MSWPNNAYQRLFLATLSSPSIPDLQVIVKLFSRSYSQDVHKHMADIGLAPKLYGYAEVKGAPTTYVMEHLNPSVWQSLYQLSKPEDKPTNKLQDALEKMIAALDEKKHVHGDLRSNNIMIRTDVMDKSVDLKVIDLTRQGKQDKFIIRQNGIERFSGLANRLSKVHDSKMVAG